MTGLWIVVFLSQLDNQEKSLAGLPARGIKRARRELRRSHEKSVVPAAGEWQMVPGTRVRRDARVQPARRVDVPALDVSEPTL